MTRFSPTSGTTSASVPSAAILTKPGSHLPLPARVQSACTSFSATPTPARCLSGYVQSWRLGLMTATRVGQRALGLVVIGDDEIDAELARPPRGVGAANAAVDRHDDVDLLGVQPIDRRRLQAVAVAQPLRDEVDDLAAEHLERAPEDDGRGDAVDVVVAVDRDPLAARQRPLEPRRRPAPCRRAETDRAAGRATGSGTGRRRPGSPKPAQAQQPRDGRMDARAPPRAPTRRRRCTAGAARGATSLPSLRRLRARASRRRQTPALPVPCVGTCRSGRPAARRR